MAYEIPKVKADGTLTDYGKSLQQREATDQEASRIMSTYKQPKEIEYVGGVYKNYEDYVGTNAGGSVMSREQHSQLLNERQQQEMNDRQNRESDSNSDSASSNIYNAINNTPSKQNYGVTNNSSLIEQSYEAQKTSALEALRNAIAKARGKQQEIISDAPKAFNSLKDQTTVAANTQLTRLREAMAEQGQAGGVSRSEETAVGTSRENQLNAINLQQQSVIDKANRDIAELEADGRTQEAQIIADNANSKIRALIEESNRVESTNYARVRDEVADKRYESETNTEQQRYNQQNANEQQRYAEQQRLIAEETAREQERYTTEFERRTQSEKDAKTQQETERKRADFASTINPKEDLTAKLNELEKQGVGADDYRVVELKKARLNKIANMDQNNFERELANIKAEGDKQEAALEYAWKKFNSGLPADPVTARLLGINAGTVIPEQKIKEVQLALDKIKASKTSTSSTNDTLNQNQALTQARQILGEGASASDILTLANQLKSGQTIDPKSFNTPTVKPPKADSSVKKVYDYLYKLENSGDLVGINAFINNKANITELEGIIKNPTSTDDEIETARLILKQFSKYK